MDAERVAYTLPWIEWAVARSTQAGQSESGDHFLLKPCANGVLVGVVDGLGHGKHAAAVSRRALETLERYTDGPITSLIERCHEALKETRGVVLSLALFDAQDQTMAWTGVGNVRGLLLYARPQAGRTHETLVLRGGVVGYRLPSLRVSTVPLTPGDTLILTTDGIRGAFSEHFTADRLTRRRPSLRPFFPAVGPARQRPLSGWTFETAQNIADSILSAYRTGKDDALVFVVRYLGTRGHAASTTGGAPG